MLMYMPQYTIIYWLSDIRGINLFGTYILDLEFETDVQTTAPEPALYETAYVTSHKGNCRAGAFSVDGQLIATGSVDASIKASILFWG